MSKNSIRNSPIGNLTKLLLNAEKLNKFKFDEITKILINMWAIEQNPLRKSLIDYIIIAAINQKDFKGLTRKQYIQAIYLLVTPKIKRASKETIDKYNKNEGLEKYL